MEYWLEDASGIPFHADDTGLGQYTLPNYTPNNYSNQAMQSVLAAPSSAAKVFEQTRREMVRVAFDIH